MHAEGSGEKRERKEKKNSRRIKAGETEKKRKEKEKNVSLILSTAKNENISLFCLPVAGFRCWVGRYISPAWESTIARSTDSRQTIVIGQLECVCDLWKLDVFTFIFSLSLSLLRVFESNNYSSRGFLVWDCGWWWWWWPRCDVMGRDQSLRCCRCRIPVLTKTATYTGAAL